MSCLLRTIGNRIDEDAPLRLTLVLLLLRPPAGGILRAATWLLAGTAVAYPPAVRSRVLWLSLGAAVVTRLAIEWPFSDNHIYLLAYWCLGIGLSLGTADPFRTLRHMSRWLIGTAFACAVAWKVLLAPDFLDARFFRVTLLTDERFASFAQTVGGLSAAQLDENRLALAPLPAGTELIDGPVLVEPPRLRALSRGLTWGGVCLEMLIAAAFLSAHPRRLIACRHLLLILFSVVTYAIAPVAGFGWLLVSMGLAHTKTTETRARLAYFAAFLIVMLYAEARVVQTMLALWQA
jgi:hypothetical protein